MSVRANDMVDHYATLGLAREAPQSVVHAAWKALVAEYHPDRNASAAAEIKTRSINEAFTVLGRPEMRAAYDEMLAASTERSRALVVIDKQAPRRLARNEAPAMAMLLFVAIGLVSVAVALRGANDAPAPAGNSATAATTKHVDATLPADTAPQPPLAVGVRLYSMIEASLKQRDTAASRRFPPAPATPD